MICPTCQKQVIAGVPTCQFCGGDLRGMAPTQKRSMFVDSDSYEPVHTGGKPGWVVPAYYIVASYFVLSGLLAILLTVTNKKSMDGSPMAFIPIAFYAVSVLLGIGLLAKIEVIRGIVNFVCGISLIFGILGLIGSFGSVLVLGGLGVLMLIRNVLDICMNAFMIYLIGETD